MSNVFVALAPGSEEIEAVVIVDTLRRAGLHVDLVSISDELTTTCSRNITLVANTCLSQVNPEDYQMLVLPGGLAGSENFSQCTKLIEALRQAQQQNRWIAAICAAPAVVLAKHQLIGDARVTCYPTFIDQLPEANQAAHRVVVDQKHKLVTSQGPGTALEFAITLIEVLCGKEKAREVAEAMII